METNKVSLNKTSETPTESKPNVVDTLNNNVNNIIEDVGNQVNQSLGNIDLGLNQVDMEKVREAELQAEQSVNESLNSSVESLQQNLDVVNNGFEKFYDSLGEGTTPVKPSDLKVNAMTSAVLSFFIIGLGQMINGQTRKGLVMLLISIGVNILITLIALISHKAIFLVVIPIITLISTIDSYKCTKMLENGKEISKDKLWFQYK